MQKSADKTDDIYLLLLKKDFAMGVFTAILCNQFLKGWWVWLTVPEKKKYWHFIDISMGKSKHVFEGIWLSCGIRSLRVNAEQPLIYQRMRVNWNLYQNISVFNMLPTAFYFEVNPIPYFIYHIINVSLAKTILCNCLAVFFSLHGPCWWYNLYQGFL